MATKTAIEWTQTTWNPVTGCDKISPGCKHCYAERMATRLKLMGQIRYQNGFKLTLQPSALEEPFRWKTPRIVFVNSMSDLFHESVPLEYLKKVFQVMNNCSRHQFQILTKRSDRLRDLAYEFNWTENIWMGVSVESEKYCFRVDDLKRVKAAIRFLSIEPLLGPISQLDLKGIHWIIVGGESGPGARPMNKDWVISLKNECVMQGVPFFFKQWGGVRRTKMGRLLENREWNEMPLVATTFR